MIVTMLFLTFQTAAVPFEVSTVDGKSLIGQPFKLPQGGSFVLANPDAIVASGQIVSIQRKDAARPAWPNDSMILLANGDRIRGKVIGGNSQSVQFEANPGTEAWKIPLTAIRAFWVVPPPADSPLHPIEYPWAVKKQDTILLRNGDTIRGTIVTVEKDGLRIKTDSNTVDSSVTIQLSRIHAVHFDPSLARLKPPAGPHFRAVLANGSRITMSATTFENGSFRCTTAFNAVVTFLPEEIVALDAVGGSVSYLSDLKPLSQKIDAFNGLSWPWSVDRSVRGLPLAIGASTYDKGIGMHSKSALTYNLAANYRRFEAVLSLDSRTGRRGCADVRVIVDGKTTDFPGVTSSTIHTVSLPVDGAKELQLVVDYGTGGDVQDDVNWGNARLIAK